MAESLRRIKGRIRSIESTKKMTRAMEMVSVAKLRPVEITLHNFQIYFTHVEKILANLLGNFKGINHTLLEPKPEIKRILICVAASDSGLCGIYNNAVIRKAEEFIRQNSKCDIRLIAIGKKALKYFKKCGANVIGSYTESYGWYSKDIAAKLADDLISAFLSGTADEVYFVYTKFISAARIQPLIEKILNVELTPNAEGVEYLIEPGTEKIIDEVMPLYVSAKLKNILLNVFASENSARVIAMHEATDNAKDLLDNLILLRNKMRQADITREIIEVVSAADALRG